MSLIKQLRLKLLRPTISYIMLSYIAIMSLSYFILSERENTLKEHEYHKHALQIKKRAETLIKEKKEAILHLALALSHDASIRTALEKNDHTNIDLDRFSKRLHDNTPLKNVWFQIIDNQGNSFYRSWTKKRGDNLLGVRLDVEEALKSHKISVTASTGRFDMTFKSTVPIFNGAEQIGLFEVITKVNSIAEKILDSGIQPVILVDKSYKNQIKFPSTGMFVGDYYVANLNASEENMALLRHMDIETLVKQEKNYFIEEGSRKLVSLYVLDNIRGAPMGYFLFFEPLKLIDLSEIEKSTQNHYLVISVVYLFFVLLIIIYDAQRRNRDAATFNQALSHQVKEKTKELHEQRSFLQEVVDGSLESLMVIKSDHSVILMNKVAKMMLDPEKVANIKAPKCFEIVHRASEPCHDTQTPCPLQQVLQTKCPSKVIHSHQNNNGETNYSEISATPLFNEKGEVWAMIEVGHDITAHINSQKALRAQKESFNHLAHHDLLTELPNRLLFIDRLEHAVENAKRNDTNLMVFFLDLDNFKQINDSLGHSAGDFLLQKIAKRLMETMRGVDTVARLGGDEFTILIEGYENEHAVNEVLEKLIKAVSEPVKYQSHTLYTSTSIGVSSYPQDGKSAEELLKNADAAMYKSKELGRNTYQFYTANMTKKAMERVLLESAIRNGLLSGEFYLVYQPQFDIRDHHLIGMEALVRWNHPEQGELPPGQFIAVCEESNLIVDMGNYVLKAAAKQAAAWFALGLDPVRIAVNLSVRQLREHHLVETIKTILDESFCSPEWIEIEVTEGYVMHNPDQAIERLRQIASLGVILAMDDFGTGYSSLSLLKRLPIHKLKIDASFIREIPGNEEDETITQAIIDLSANLHLEVLAEGVEHEAQHQFLLDHHCYNAQGYFYGQPVEAGGMTSLLKSLR